MSVHLPRWYTAVSAVMHLELMGRVRSKKWILAMLAWLVTLVAVWLGALALSDYFSGEPFTAQDRYFQSSSTFAWMLLFTLLVALIIAPALSSTAINGQRQTSNLAIVQATPIASWHVLCGKLLAGWVTGAVFVLVAAIVLGVIAGVTALSGVLLMKSLVFILFEVFVVCALGLGFSALVVRPVISVLLTYLVVGALSIGGPLAFLFTINPMMDRVEYEAQYLEYEGTDDPWQDAPDEEYPGLNENPGWVCRTDSGTEYVSHEDRTWWMNMSSPVVIMADAVESITEQQNVEDGSEGFSADRYNVFDSISQGIALVRIPTASEADVRAEILDVDPPRISSYDSCYINSEGLIVPLEITMDGYDVVEDRFDDGDDVPEWMKYVGHSWYWGVGLHLVLALGALTAAWVRLRIPVKRLPSGVRIA